MLCEPIILGQNPPTKEITVFRAGEGKGTVCVIQDAIFPDGVVTGDPIDKFDDRVSRGRTLCWLQFENPEAMTAFGSLLIDCARKSEDGTD